MITKATIGMVLNRLMKIGVKVTISEYDGGIIVKGNNGARKESFEQPYRDNYDGILLESLSSLQKQFDSGWYLKGIMDGAPVFTTSSYAPVKVSMIKYNSQICIQSHIGNTLFYQEYLDTSWVEVSQVRRFAQRAAVPIIEARWL